MYVLLGIYYFRCGRNSRDRSAFGGRNEPYTRGRRQLNGEQEP